MRENYLTVDVEEYFAEAPDKTPEPPSRLEMQMERVLALLESTNNKATFFFLAKHAARMPNLVRQVIEHGHEVASHARDHYFLYSLSETEQKAQIADSKKMLEDIAGKEILGFRAPFFSIVRRNLRAMECIADAGYKYDSSVFAGSHPRYGHSAMPHAPYFVEMENGRTLLEIPPTTIKLCFWRIGVGSGAYLRLFPYKLTQRWLRNISELGQPLVLYFHPWELDREQPTASYNATFKFRHYTNLSKMEARLKAILTAYSFSKCSDCLLHDYPHFSFVELLGR